MMKHLFAVLGVSAVGCAGARVAPEKFEQSQASIRGAEEVGADKVPAAKLHLQFAKDQTDRAKKMSAEGDARAELMLARARSDAELAVALSREEATRQEAARAADELKALRGGVKP